MQFAKKKCAVLTTTTIELSFLISFMVIRKDAIKKPWYWTLWEGEGAKWYYCKSHCLHLTRVFFPRFSFADSCSAFEMGKLC